MKKYAARVVAVASIMSLLGAFCSDSSVVAAAPMARALVTNGSTDKSTARALNLASADLPGKGWQSTPNQPDSSGQEMSAQLAACAGAPNPNKIDIADVGSAYFDRGVTEVSSDVVMVRTQSDGLADLHAMQGSKVKSCVAHIYVKALEAQMPSGTRISKFDIAGYQYPWMPSNSFAFGVALTVLSTVKSSGTSTKTSVQVHLDSFGFLSGRAEITLTVDQTGAARPSQSLEQQLFSVLLARAKKYSAATR
jgi:hypothetical protein